MGRHELSEGGTETSMFVRNEKDLTTLTLVTKRPDGTATSVELRPNIAATVNRAQMERVNSN